MTAQLSKAVERMLLRVMTPHITELTLGGANQFAYTKERGARDVLAFLLLRWISALEKGWKVAIYCSDVAGAFDRVSSSRLVDKLKAKRFHPDIVKVIESWLKPRRAAVIVGGAKSDEFSIKDMIYQGTVLGPPLWNTFFEDASAAIREFSFEEIVYADDLNASREFIGSTPNETILQSVVSSKPNFTSGETLIRLFLTNRRRVNTCSRALIRRGVASNS